MIYAAAIIFLALFGVPLFALFGAGSMALFLSLPEGSWASPAIDVFSAKFAENPTLATIPLFTFAGYLLAESGTPQRLVELSRAWLGWMPGGLAVVCMMASAFFTTFTGGSGVTIVAVGGLLLPALIGEKYPERFSMGLVTTGGSLGLLFPPSVPLVFYAIIAGLVVEKVLVAGILPGMVVMAVLAVYSAYISRNANVPRHPFRWKRAFATLWVAKWEVVIPVVLIAGIATGLLRIHEASAFTAVYVLFIELFIYRDIGVRKDLPRIVIESMMLVGAILVIMAAAIGFTGWMIQAEIPTALLTWMQKVMQSKVMFLLSLNVFLFIVGMLMDVFSAIVVVVPLILPMAYAYGVDPYHLAIIFILNLEIGYLTPPVGLNLFISSIRFGRSLGYVTRSVLPFIGILIITLGIVTYVPIITTWIPDKMKVEGEVKSLGGGFLADDAFDDEGTDLPMAPETPDGGWDDLLGPGDGGLTLDGGTAVDDQGLFGGAAAPPPVGGKAEPSGAPAGAAAPPSGEAKAAGDKPAPAVPTGAKPSP